MGEVTPAIHRRGGVDVTIAQWLHLVGAGLAGGTMFFLIFALFPSLGAIGGDSASRLFSEMAWRLRAIFWAALVLLSLGGLYLTVSGSGITSLEQLFGSAYGRLLSVKIALALVVSTLALLLTLPFPFLTPIQEQTPAILPFVFALAGTVVLLGAVLRRMRVGSGV